jgi:Asp-tRNA(Asn)/Glu-tRNA(Gln) amidotransferase A subunit family amidase
MTEPCDLTAVAARRLIGARKLSPVELLDSCLARIGAVNHAVNAMVALDTDRARETARAAEAAVMAGTPLGPLHGLPVGIKDLEETKGLRTTWGSPLFADHVPVRDEAMVANLRAAGAIVLGKTNTPEFGAGANTRNLVYGATGNAFDPRKSAAGSSGGSAVALATGMVPIASGSDTGGSLRNPAAFNGIVGFRPRPGWCRASGAGSAGPTCRCWGRWPAPPRIARCCCRPWPTTTRSTRCLHPARARGAEGRPGAVPADAAGPVDAAGGGDARFRLRADRAPHPGVFAERVAKLESMFARVEQASPDCRGSDEAFEVLRAASFLQGHLEKVRKTPDQVGPNVRANVEEGLRYSLADYARAAAEQTRLYRVWQHFFRDHDLLVSPAITISPRDWRELYPAEIDGQPTRTYFHWLALAYAVTLVGHPAISIPLGRDRAGMPFGLQIVGPRGGDALVLAAAAAIEAAVAGDPDLARPAPDLAALRAAPRISDMPEFRTWG